jgi:hypothetical protein
MALAYKYNRQKRFARLLALSELYFEDRICLADEKNNEICVFLEIFRQLPKDLRNNVFLPTLLFETEGKEEPDGQERVIAMDTVSIWIRSILRKKRETGFFFFF